MDRSARRTRHLVSSSRGWCGGRRNRRRALASATDPSDAASSAPLRCRRAADSPSLRVASELLFACRACLPAAEGSSTTPRATHRRCSDDIRLGQTGPRRAGSSAPHPLPTTPRPIRSPGTPAAPETRPAAAQASSTQSRNRGARPAAATHPSPLVGPAPPARPAAPAPAPATTRHGLERPHDLLRLRFGEYQQAARRRVSSQWPAIAGLEFLVKLRAAAAAWAPSAG